MACTLSHTANFELSSDSNPELRGVFPCLSPLCCCISNAQRERMAVSLRHRESQGFVQTHTAL